MFAGNTLNSRKQRTPARVKKQQQPFALQAKKLLSALTLVSSADSAKPAPTPLLMLLFISHTKKVIKMSEDIQEFVAFCIAAASVSILLSVVVRILIS